LLGVAVWISGTELRSKNQVSRGEKSNSTTLNT